jgi:hypothetical protein
VKPTLQTSGYSTIYHGGVTYLLHRLIYETLKGKKIAEGMQIDHVNGDKSDNNVLNLCECTREENLYNVESRRKLPFLLENLRTREKHVYSSKTELFKEKAIKIPHMNKPFFSKVHELYFKATPVRGNGYDDMIHCGQETITTTEKEAAALWSSQSAPHNSIQRIPVKGKPMNYVIATCAKAINTRSLEGKLNGTLCDDVIAKFAAYCDKYNVEGALLDSGYFSLNRMNGGKIQLMNGLVTLEKHLGLPVERTFAGYPTTRSSPNKIVICFS